MYMTKRASVLEGRVTYKPFSHPEFYNLYQQHERAHWLPSEVPMADDIADFNHKLTKEEKNLITQILRFFTLGDQEVGNNYNTKLLSRFKLPEVIMMLTGFAAREMIHIDAYSQLNDTLGLPDEDYNAFLGYQEMRDKYNYMKSFDSESINELMVNLAVFGGFIEGVSLFGSFAILMNFPRRGLLKNVGQIISWSVLDENKHSEGVSRLFKTLVSEYPEYYTLEVIDAIYGACRDMVELEDKFIDLCYEQGPVEGLTSDQVKEYIRYMADYRLKGLDLDPIYKIKENPLPWMVSMIYGKEHMNFFEGRSTEYSKGSVTGDFF